MDPRTATPSQRSGRVEQLLSVLRLMGEAQEGLASLPLSLRAIAEMAALLAGAANAGVYVADEDTDTLRLVASYGLPERDSDESGMIPLHAAPWARNPQSRFVPRVAAGVAPTPDSTPAPFRDSAYWVPLIRGGRAVGQLVVGGIAGESPDGLGLEFLRLVGIYATTLIDAVRSRDLLNQRISALTTLFEVGQALSSTLEHERVLKLIIDSVARLSRAAACSIMLLDERRETLRIRMAIGVPEYVVRTAVRKVGEGFAGRVAQTGEAIFLRDVAKATGIKGCNPSRYRSPSMIVVPLRARGQVIGVLNVNDKQDGEFTTEDLNLITLFAHQAAIAIDNAKMHDQLWRTSVTDGLTQTYVHSYFDERLEDLVTAARSRQGMIAVIMTDLDHFKDVNDNFGHPSGDRVLQGVAALLRRGTRSHDLVARYGGEEFVLVLSDVAPAVVLAIAERLRRAVEAARFGDGAGPGISITASFGIAAMPFDGTDAASLVHEADRNLYASKHAGRNRVTASAAFTAAATATAPAVPPMTAPGGPTRG